MKKQISSAVPGNKLFWWSLMLNCHQTKCKHTDTNKIWLGLARERMLSAFVSSFDFSSFMYADEYTRTLECVEESTVGWLRAPCGVKERKQTDSIMLWQQCSLTEIRSLWAWDAHCTCRSRTCTCTHVLLKHENIHSYTGQHKTALFLWNLTQERKRDHFLHISLITLYVQ